MIRLNIGCGASPRAGWINIDLRNVAGVNMRCDITRGLPLADRCVDYAVAIHFLQDLPWMQLSPALAELYRVLRPGGVLRLALPDLDRAIEAYRRQDRSYFYVPDAHARSLGGKLVTQLIWYGSVRTPFTYDYVEELLSDAGFDRVRRCAFRQTFSQHADIVGLDNRPRESLFVEAAKSPDPLSSRLRSSRGRAP